MCYDIGIYFATMEGTMKLLVVQLTDLHIKDREDEFSINIDEMIKSLKLVGDVDKIVIATSGDIAFSGKKEEYNCANGFLKALFKKLRKNFDVKNVEHIVVPGNHDINFDNLDRNFEEIQRAYKEKRVKLLVDNDLKYMNDFWLFANEYGCFDNQNRIIFKKTIKVGDKAIGFIMVNTVPLSLLKGSMQDKGYHYLTSADLESINRLAADDINILVMHHNFEWYEQKTKDKFRDIMSKKYQMILSGHEHVNISEERKINDTLITFCSQGYAMSGIEEKRGFNAFCIDLDEFVMKPYTFSLVNGVYSLEEHSEVVFPQKTAGLFQINPSKLNDLMKDDDGDTFEDYFVFPELSYDTQESEEDSNISISDLDDLAGVALINKKVVISGEKKYGKTCLAKLLWKTLLHKSDVIPIILFSSEINQKKISKISQYALEELYNVDDESYTVFLQQEKKNRVVILDEFEKIGANAANELISTLESEFGHIIIFSEDTIDIDLKRQAKETLIDEEAPLQLRIKPFFYAKRKELITKVLKREGKYTYEETEKINKLINSQVKFFDLSPDFLISFINQYESQYQFNFASGVNTFSVVYENSIKSKVIKHSANIDPGLALNILGELAFDMHFSKKCKVQISDISEVIKKYNLSYRQKVNEMQFVNAMIDAKILSEKDNMYRFKDATIEAYFVARAINQKNSMGEDIKADIEYMLNNLCFGINSDVVLYLSLINNDPRFLNIILEGAERHFAEYEEISFDIGNINNLLCAPVTVKNEIPTQEDKKARDIATNRQEESIETVVQLVDEYDYTEEDLLKIENQILISFKYLEILCKTLPAFCYNMKVEMQDRMTELLYICPNKFLYSILKDISDNKDDIVKELISEVKRQGRNDENITIEYVNRVIEKISANLILGIYNLVATTCSTEQSIRALNAYDCSNNTNYQIQNLLMRCQCDDISQFSSAAIRLDEKVKDSVLKSFIRFAVREYLIKHNRSIVGDTQSLLDHFFPGKIGKRRVVLDNAKSRYISKK